MQSFLLVTKKVPKLILALGDAPYAKSTPKKVKTFWGITRINIFDDCSKTYEIMGITPYQPQYVPDQIDGIFVIGPPSKDK